MYEIFTRRDPLNVSREQAILLLGDTLVLALVTLYGLGIHETLSSAGTDIWRTLVPWLAAWLLVGRHVGVFEVQGLSLRHALGRAFWGMILASPVAGFLRAAWLGKDVVVVFVVIFGGISALSVTAWRGLYWMLMKQRAAGG